MHCTLEDGRSFSRNFAVREGRSDKPRFGGVFFEKPHRSGVFFGLEHAIRDRYAMRLQFPIELPINSQTPNDASTPASGETRRPRNADAGRGTMEMADSDDPVAADSRRSFISRPACPRPRRGLLCASSEQAALPCALAQTPRANIDRLRSYVLRAPRLPRRYRRF